MQRTAIEWTTFSANPLKYRRKSDGKEVWACIKHSSGCAHCYSEAIALRFNRGKVFNAANMEELEPFLDEAELRRMRTAKVVGGTAVADSLCFLGDMTDLFGEWVPDDLLNRLFSEVLERRTDVTWQLLTKRAERMRDYLSWRWGEGRIPARNIYCGVSVENQAAADERIPLLLQTPAAVRFLSVEPLLEPIQLWRQPIWCRAHNRFENDMVMDESSLCFEGQTYTWDMIDWVICGCESGSRRRPMELDWVRDLRDEVHDGGGAFFMKQLEVTGRVTGELDDFPADLRVRKFPR